MVLADKKVYEDIKKLISVGKYSQAYEMCKSHQCKDKTMVAKINCAKYILRNISSFSDTQITSFKWITSIQKDRYIPIRHYKREMNLNFITSQINELRHLFDLK